MKYLSNIDLSRNELQNVRIQNLAVAPSNPSAGLIYFDTDLNQFGVFNGSVWQYLTPTSVNNTTKATNASASNVLQVSAGSDRTLADFTSAGGLVKVSTTGVVSLAVPGTDYVIPSGLVGLTRKFNANLGNGTLTTIVVTDNLNTLDKQVAVYEVATGAQVICDNSVSLNTTTFTFNIAPASNSLRAVIIG